MVLEGGKSEEFDTGGGSWWSKTSRVRTGPGSEAFIVMSWRVGAVDFHSETCLGHPVVHNIPMCVLGVK